MWQKPCEIYEIENEKGEKRIQDIPLGVGVEPLFAQQ